VTGLAVSAAALLGTLTVIAWVAHRRGRRRVEDRRRTAADREAARADRIERRRRLGLPDTDQREPRL
jgi:hypothetical protein